MNVLKNFTVLLTDGMKALLKPEQDHVVGQGFSAGNLQHSEFKIHVYTFTDNSYMGKIVVRSYSDPYCHLISLHCCFFVKVLLPQFLCTSSDMLHAVPFQNNHFYLIFI
jgi:hypothetical protein